MKFVSSSMRQAGTPCITDTGSVQHFPMQKQIGQWEVCPRQGSNVTIICAMLLPGRSQCGVCCRSTELVKNFTEDAYSVSMHPSGLTVLLGFADKLRLMTVLMDDFR